MSSILNSRFLLSLYETNVQIERGGLSTLSFSDIDFNGVNRAGSPELPAFLSSLAGPIHSMTNEDPEIFEPELTDREPLPEEEAGRPAETWAQA